MMNDDVQLYNLPTTMGKFTHNGLFDVHQQPCLMDKIQQKLLI